MMSRPNSRVARLGGKCYDGWTIASDPTEGPSDRTNGQAPPNIRDGDVARAVRRIGAGLVTEGLSPIDQAAVGTESDCSVSGRGHPSGREVADSINRPTRAVCQSTRPEVNFMFSIQHGDKPRTPVDAMSTSTQIRAKRYVCNYGILNVTGGIRCRDGLILRRFCPCGTSFPWVQPLDEQGQRGGRPHPITHHCTQCHSKDHSACLQCGRCDPKEIDARRRYKSHIQYRADRLYCSNSCRQKAYRRRAVSASNGRGR